jgi:hypothetical protein
MIKFQKKLMISRLNVKIFGMGQSPIFIQSFDQISVIIIYLYQKIKMGINISGQPKVWNAIGTKN